ncbi:MAG: two-component system, cell cycle sensor histidine kinase PleC [Kribbellaceae bacterium]|jgi:signal transduction histidine kinase|nr:two-component system, cell cycle sensor histidine kinase PleC [Kribbellaceae bacterium]
MGAASMPERIDQDESEYEEPAQLLRLCHDLSQYVAAGLLLSESDNEPAGGGQHRLALINQQFASIAELIAGECDATHHKDVVNLTQLVGECAEVVRVTHRVSVATEGAARAMAFGDKALLRRAISNILDNASRAAGTAGRVRVCVGVDGADAYVEISDDGAGFGGITHGTGHGLQLVAAAVRASRGRLEISSGPGPGTTVRLLLPARQLPVRHA